MEHMGFETTITKYCTLCHKVEKVTVGVYINTNWYDDAASAFTADVCESNNMSNLTKKCEACGSMHTILLDEKMGYVIAELNKKGYKTLFSCDGYKDKLETSYPYIAFSQDVPADIFNTLPDGWDVHLDSDIDSVCKSIGRSGFNTTIYYKWEFADDDITSWDWDLDAMVNWAKNLPLNDVHDIIKTSGERYELHDIKVAYEMKGYTVQSINALQTNPNPLHDNTQWVVIVEFEGDVPQNSIPQVSAFKKDSLAITLNRLDTDSISDVVENILYKVDQYEEK